MKTIGAYATIQWLNENDCPPQEAYFSFGEFDSDNDTDTFDVADSDIFYYVTGEDELKKLMAGNGEFKVTDYELEYQD